MGAFGDYAVFSLPKLLPMERGGILVMPEHGDIPATPASLSSIQEELNSLLPYLPWLSDRRKSCFSALRKTIAQFEPFFEMTKEITPFFFGIWTDRTPQIRLDFPNVDWGSTMHDNLLLVPTNPLITTQAIVEAVDQALRATGPVR